MVRQGKIAPGICKDKKENGETTASVDGCLLIVINSSQILFCYKWDVLSVVDESDPNDSDVALDPELLGAYTPETKETARKQSDSFKAHSQCGAGIPACRRCTDRNVCATLNNY